MPESLVDLVVSSTAFFLSGFLLPITTSGCWFGPHKVFWDGIKVVFPSLLKSHLEITDTSAPVSIWNFIKVPFTLALVLQRSLLLSPIVPRNTPSSSDSESVMFSPWTTSSLIDLYTRLKCPVLPHLLQRASFAGGHGQVYVHIGDTLAFLAFCCVLLLLSTLGPWVLFLFLFLSVLIAQLKRSQNRLPLCRLTLVT